MTESEKRATSSNGVPAGALLTISVVLIVLYIAGLVFLYTDADNQGVDEKIWARYTFLIGGLEAVVFTAVGWLFGREVNRKQAEQAQDATANAQQSAADAAAAKAKGESLKNAVLNNPAMASGGLESTGGSATAVALETLRKHAQGIEF
jgi:hypothetical protein